MEAVVPEDSRCTCVFSWGPWNPVDRIWGSTQVCGLIAVVDYFPRVMWQSLLRPQLGAEGSRFSSLRIEGGLTCLTGIPGNPRWQPVPQVPKEKQLSFKSENIISSGPGQEVQSRYTHTGCLLCAAGDPSLTEAIIKPFHFFSHFVCVCGGG